MNLREVHDLMERVTEDPHPCRQGHPRCSDIDGGVCSFEMWSSRASDESESHYKERMGE
jgi:hypothetical protein